MNQVGGVKMEIAINVTLPVFEGPLDLLLHLLEKNEVDIYDIPIASITEQFLTYLKTYRALKIDATSEFVLMAAHLLEIKSRMLLPIHGEVEEGEVAFSEEDPRFDLVQRLIAYRQYKEAAQAFDVRQTQYSGVFFKNANELSRYHVAMDFQDDSVSLDINALQKALQQVIERLPLMDLNRRDYFKKLHRDAHAVEHKIEFLKTQFLLKNTWSFSTLVQDAKTKLEVVVTFLALLELLKTGKLRVSQTVTFDDIKIDIDEDFDYVQSTYEAS